METSIAEVELRRILRRPETKTGTPSSPEDWDAAERIVGSGLPADYKRFIEDYGAGSVAGLCILSPFCEPSLARISRDIVSNTIEGLSLFLPGESLTDPLCFASWFDGAELFWERAASDADSWKCTYFDAKPTRVDRFDCGFAALLASAISGKLTIPHRTGLVPRTAYRPWRR